ncbi:hypothetical protein IV203_032274 [Nitzschia inconspicua]|uniref:PiggyBac transposable element-derived protein domain-containing protein n=1 Tax=Nitzschia inconspicua TaxID=303405 RepID=A0A9K3KKN1_9STRA|nr:hypothetical protein IV203_022561 [Nitzschia inconspicua]KAG7344743.1 hypothetical protein IV203_032274 [Nitzschia inconspicua]
MWSPKKYWYQEKHNKPWDIFAPAMDSFNAKSKKLIKVICLMMDESMIGWGPKTSKRGGLPKITFEPRKPVPLGTMLRNSLDCVTGILVHQDIAMDAEVQTEDDSSRRETTSSTSPSSKTLGGVAPSKVDSIRILKFTDMMCGGLKQWPKPKQHFLIVGNEDGKGDGRLTRIYGKDGERTKPPAKQQEQQGRNIGNAYVWNCFVCRGYLSKKGKQINNQTSFWCSKCHMPLCRIDRSKDEEFGPPGSRHLTCFDAHYHASHNSVICCGKMHGQKEQFPKEEQLSLHPRRSSRK